MSETLHEMFLKPFLTQPISKFINNEITWSCPMSTHTKFCLFTLMVFFLQKIPPSFAGGICLLYSLLCVCSLLSSWVIPVSWFNDYRLSKEERMHFGSKEWKGGKRLVMGPGLPSLAWARPDAYVFLECTEPNFWSRTQALGWPGPNFWGRALKSEHLI